MTEGSCANYFDGDLVVSVDYDPVTKGCARYTCDSNIGFTDDMNAWLKRKTINAGKHHI